MASAQTISAFLDGPIPPSDTMWVEVAGGRYVGMAPSKRLPLYTRGNAGEVFPEVTYPLSFTTSGYRADRAAARAVLKTGGMRPGELVEPGALISTLCGYAYLNASSYRLMSYRTPGASVADADQQYLGSSSAPPFRPQKGDRWLGGGINVLRYILKAMNRPSMRQQLDDEAEFVTWKSGRKDPKSMSDTELVDAIRGVADYAERLFENHLVVSGLAGAPVTLLNKLCTKKLKDPGAMASLMSGIGNIDSAAPAVALWDLGRLVRSSVSLSSHFDAGTDGLDARLRSGGESAFVAAFDEFLDEFGSRGPNEWETACPTWGTQPDMALALVDRLRLTGDDNDPRAAAARLVEERTRAYERASATLGKRGTKQLDKILKALTIYSQGREKAKTTIVKLIQQTRVESNELASRCAARSGDGARHDDMWFVTSDELDDYIAAPSAFLDTIAERRAMREKLASRVPPFIVDGVVPPWETWEVRGATRAEQAAPGQKLTGIAGCPGVARGIARVIVSPADPRGLEPGDVLVAPLTDPAWTPLFLAAEAVVVDVGAVLSHAVIVSRELGIPSVVSVTDATRIIPDGALIEVDGSSGTVTVLALPSA